MMSKYQPLEGRFKREGFDLVNDGVHLRLSHPPRTIQPNHRSAYFLHEVDEVGSLGFVSAVWSQLGELFFSISNLRFAIDLDPDSAIIRFAPSTPSARIPFVYHRDFVALNATSKTFTTGFQPLKKVGK